VKWLVVVDWAAIIIAPIAAVAAETLMRHWRADSYFRTALWTMPIAILVNYAIFRIMAKGDSLLGSMVMWSFMTQTGRLISTVFFLKEQPSWATWVAWLLVLACQVIMRYGR
jgi:hypothetical protein